MMRTLRRGLFTPTLFTNVALNPETNEPWWEGLDGPMPENLLDWQGRPWKAPSKEKAAHPNSRFTVSIYNTPTLSPEFDNPQGVPISAIIFGGRRAHLIPLVVESFDWAHGVFLGARMGSETTAAAAGEVGVVRRDPMAMLPFCGYNLGVYFRHWINMGHRLVNPPKIFAVNWFRLDEKGRFIWPGFGENMRVLKWIVDRVKGRVEAKETAIGLLPRLEDLELDGLTVPRERIASLFEVKLPEWKGEVAEVRRFLKQYGQHIPREIQDDLEELERAVKA